MFVATVQDFLGRSSTEGEDKGDEKAECDKKETKDEEEKNNTGKQAGKYKTKESEASQMDLVSRRNYV